jgi:hypothetical protein
VISPSEISLNAEGYLASVLRHPKEFIPMRKLLAALALAALGCSAVQAKLPGGISGTWYNPEQNGHGLSVNLVHQDLAVVIWHVFDTAGNPLTLYIQGPVHGRTFDGVAYAPSGMQFGSFDPEALQLPVWGEVSIDFSDCEQAVLRWSASDPAYGSGEIPIQRLTFVHGVDCQLPPPNSLPSGLYSGNFATLPGRSGGRGVGIVDLEGRLWGMQRWTPEGVPIPLSGNWVFDPGQVVVAVPTAVDGARIDVAITNYPNLWAFGTGTSTSVSASTGAWSITAPIVGDFDAGPAHFSPRPQQWLPGAPFGMALVAPVSMQQVAGAYAIALRDQFLGQTGRLTVSAAGVACIVLRAPAATNACDFEGQVRTPEGDAGLVDFEFRRTGNPALPTYRGRGWLATVDGAHELVLVGGNGFTGFGLVGQ